jgi:hypothetical protein
MLSHSNMNLKCIQTYSICNLGKRKGNRKWEKAHGLILFSLPFLAHGRPAPSTLSSLLLSPNWASASAHPARRACSLLLSPLSLSPTGGAHPLASSPISVHRHEYRVDDGVASGPPLPPRHEHVKMMANTAEPRGLVSPPLLPNISPMGTAPWPRGVTFPVWSLPHVQAPSPLDTSMNRMALWRTAFGPEHARKWRKYPAGGENISAMATAMAGL